MTHIAVLVRGSEVRGQAIQYLNVGLHYLGVITNWLYEEHL